MRPGRSGRSPQRGIGRRQFVVGAGLAALGGPAFLTACSDDSGGGGPAGPSPGATGGLQLASPSNPVTWPITPGNQPIADGLSPEQGATLQVYNWADYVEPAVIAAFETTYRCKVNISTFDDMDEALAKVSSGTTPFDVWMGVGYDVIARLVTGSLIRPLNHSYIPNISNVWPSFTNPWYDQNWQYSVPFTVYTSGLGWRTDMMKTDPYQLRVHWDTLWDTRYRGLTAVWDDSRSTIEMCLLKEGIADVNSGRAEDLDRAGSQLMRLSRTTQPALTIEMYLDFPAGKYAQCTIWSGDIVNAAAAADDPSVFRYWYGEDGGMVDNDLLLLPKSGANPVLGHLFLNHMLDSRVAMQNFGFMGYQPPQVSVNPDTMVEQGLVPENLSSVVIREGDFRFGAPALELSPEVKAAWQNTWLAFKGGA
jgi:spermidine/putrescine transport system substrate-binding protein